MFSAQISTFIYHNVNILTSYILPKNSKTIFEPGLIYRKKELISEWANTYFQSSKSKYYEVNIYANFQHKYTLFHLFTSIIC